MPKSMDGLDLPTLLKLMERLEHALLVAEQELIRLN